MITDFDIMFHVEHTSTIHYIVLRGTINEKVEKMFYVEHFL